jgi:hypothetical protein
MARHRTTPRFLVALIGATLLFSGSASFAAVNLPGSSLRNAASQNGGFGSAVAATHLGIVHVLWREPASHTELKMHRVPCAAPGDLSAGTTCFAAATAG